MWYTIIKKREEQEPRVQVVGFLTKRSIASERFLLPSKFFKKMKKGIDKIGSTCYNKIIKRKEVQTMNKQTMIRNYRKFSAADAYILGFIYKHQVYMVEVAEIMPRYMRVEHESSKKGGCAKLQLRLPKQYQEQLIRKGAVAIGSEEILNGEYNKGVEFERIISEMNGVEFRGKDNVPFYVEGDLNINGKEVQIKFNGAQIVVERTLKKLQKRA